MKKNIIKRVVAFLSVACLCMSFASCKLKDKINDWIDSEVDKVIDSIVSDVSTPDSNSSSVEDDSSDSGGGNTSNDNEDSSSGGDTSSDNEDSSSGGNSSNDETVNVELNKPVETGLVSPSNEVALIESSVTALEGAALYMSSARPALKFTFRTTKTLVELVEENRYPVCIVAPLSVFNKVNTSAYTYIDWYEEIRAASLGNQCNVLSLESREGDGYTDLYCTLMDITYENINTKYVAVLMTYSVNDGELIAGSCKYNAYSNGIDYRSNARSVSMVAGAALNAHALGLTTFTDSNLNTLKSYINESVDQANGLSAATADGSVCTVSIKSGTTAALAVNEYLPLKITLSPTIDMPILYRSSDKSIVTVDDYGNVKGVGVGTAVIRVYVAGEIIKITVTVT